MKLRGLSAVAMFLALCILQTQGSTLYAVAPDNEGEERIVYSVQVDTSTGVVTKVTGIVELSGSLPFDGVSAFDKTNGIYYWANTFSDTIYGVNVNFELVTSITFNATAIYQLHYDSNDQILLILYQAPNGTFVASATLSESGGSPSILFQIPSTFDTDAILRSTWNDLTQEYILLGRVDPVTFDVAMFDLSGGLLSQTALDNATCNNGPFFNPQYFTSDPDTNNLIGSVQIYVEDPSESFSNYATTINPRTGICKMTQIAAPNANLETFAYDPLAHLLWFVQNNEMAGAALYAFDTMAGKLLQPVNVQSPWMPQNIEIYK